MIFLLAWGEELKVDQSAVMAALSWTGNASRDYERYGQTMMRIRIAYRNSPSGVSHSRPDPPSSDA